MAIRSAAMAKNGSGLRLLWEEEDLQKLVSLTSISRFVVIFSFVGLFLVAAVAVVVYLPSETGWRREVDGRRVGW